VSEFVEECRREWRRLGVPDPVANEMAADLTADLDEAEAEGSSPEDVLGNSAFDPRRFAAAWAIARGVTGPPTPDHRPFRRSPIAITLTVLLSVLTVGAALVLLIGRHGSAFAFATRKIVSAAPGSIKFFPPGPGRIGLPGPFGSFVGSQVSSVGIRPLALLFLMVGVLGLGLLAFLYWSPWFGPRRYRRHGGGRTPRWN